MDTKITDTEKPEAIRHDGTAEDASAQTWFTIGDLAKEFGVTHRTLRFYEDKNLLSPFRDGTARLYSRKDRARLSLILSGKRVGLSLMEIRDLLNAYSKKDQGRRQMKLAFAKFQEQENLLRAQKQDIDHALNEVADTLTAMRRKLADGGRTGSR